MARTDYTPKPLTDKDKMPSGKYKDTLMEEVPASYLIYVYENDMCKDSVRQYIEANMETIKAQAKQEGKRSRDT